MLPVSCPKSRPTLLSLQPPGCAHRCPATGIHSLANLWWDHSHQDAFDHNLPGTKNVRVLELWMRMQMKPSGRRLVSK